MQGVRKYLFVDGGGALSDGKRRIVALLAQANLSLAEMAGALGISVPTATKFITELIAEGVVEDLGKVETAGGRRPNIFGLTENDLAFLGIDGSCRVLCNMRGETIDPQQKHTIIAVGATSASSESFDVPLYMVSPAAARCYLERGETKNMLYIDLGSSYSAGIMINGEPYAGHSGMAGTFIGAELIEGDVSETVENALNDNIDAISILERLASRMGFEVGAAIALLNPEEVVIGGPLSAAGDYLMLPLQAAIHRHTPKDIYRSTRFRLAEYDENAAARGAALMALDKTLNKK